MADAAQPHFPELAKRQAVQMCVDGATMSAAARAVGASVTSVSGWLKEDTRLRGNGCAPRNE